MGDVSLKFIAGAIGIALGAFYAISGFSDSGKTDDLSKNQRVKNLLWLLGGVVAVLGGDWNQLSARTITPEFRATLVAIYVICALLAAFGGIVLIAITIAIALRSRSATAPQFKGRISE